MAEPSRYSINDEDAGITKQGILKNRLGITDQKHLNDTETILLSDTYEHFFELLSQDKLVVEFSLLFHIHAYFFEPLYSWAGSIRTIDISKDGILFVPARYIDQALTQFENSFQKNIPDVKDTKRDIAKKLARIHVEINVIHPFREGNGRTIRLFVDLLAASVGYNPVDWGKQSQKMYIKACIKGMAQEYGGMERLIFAGLAKKNIESKKTKKQ